MLYIYIYIYICVFIHFTLCFLKCFELIGSYFYEFDMPKKLCELIATRYEFLHFMFPTLLLLISFSSNYNFRM